MINTLPEFESRQVLTSDELNWLTCYLDSQNRQSRRFLIGCGLIGGLQVRLIGNTVQLTNGIGITSAGHIVSLQKSGADITTFTKIKKYEPKNKEKLAFHYLADLDPESEDYSKSIDSASLYFQNFKNDVFEIFEETVNDADPIVSNNLKGKVLMLFAEIIQKELKDCEDDNCQERGKKYLFQTKPLIISKEDALLLLSNEYKINSNNEIMFSKLAYPWLHLPNLNILKPAFSNISVNSNLNETHINEEYIRCIKDFNEGLLLNKNVLEEGLKNLKNYCTSAKGNFQIIDKLLLTISKTKVLGNHNNQPLLFQFVYDYLWTFTKAYQEILVEAQNLKAKVFTDEIGFPNHIFAGLVDTVNIDFEASISSSYSIFRHEFQSRLVQSEQAKVSNNLSILLNRLQSIVSNFDETFLTNKKDIKITPGGDLYQKLSNQTIPFYLKNETNLVWNNRATHSNLSQNNTKYNFTNESQVASNKLNYNTLASSFQGNHRFFRVEGPHKQPALNALNTVFQIRKKHGLAFEVLMLRLNEKAPFSHSFNFTINEDIESMYQVVRAELRKQIQLNVNYLWSLQLKTGKFNTIQKSLIKALEASYFSFLGNLNATILTTPLPMVFADAVFASNITNSYAATYKTAEPRFAELEKKTADATAITNSAVKMESATLNINSNNFITAEIFQPTLDFQISVLFFNTLGNLVDSIHSNDKFKDTTDISFYTHLLSVAKSMQKTEKSELLFLMALQLYCALKLQEEYLSENFLELDVAKYKSNLDSSLLTACNTIINYLKKLNADFVRNDAILAEVVKGEMLDYADRIKFDDDWIKIIQIDAENKKRNGGLGVENLFGRFVKLHPGIAHGCGVPKGGTYIMVYDQNNEVTADFYLPYIISSHLRPIQYTLLETKTITLSGNIKEENGAIIVASLLIGGSTYTTDNQGFYNALVAENTTVKVICKVAGFLDFEQNVVMKSVPETLAIVLKKQNLERSTTLKFVDQTGANITIDLNLTDLATNKLFTAIAGKHVIKDVASTTYKFKVTDGKFEEKEFIVVTGNTDKEEVISLIKVDQILIRIMDNSANKYTPSLLKSVKIVNPERELDTSDTTTGFFTTKEATDITISSTAVAIYNGQTKSIPVKPRQEVYELLFEAAAPAEVKGLDSFAVMVYPEDPFTGSVPPKISNILINKVTLLLDPQTNIGRKIVPTDGTITLDKRLVNAPVLKVNQLPTVVNSIYVINGKIIADKIEIKPNSNLLSFTKALTDLEIRNLMANRKELVPLARSGDLKPQNFYCFILPEQEIKMVKEILNV
ncbi:MAG: hypothetical protein V4683_15880 [Bacteroidota bacterium]